MANSSVVSFPRTGITFTKSISNSTATSRGIFVICFSIGRRCLHEYCVKCDHKEMFSLLAQVTAEMWVIFPTSHDAQLTPRCTRQIVVPLQRVELDQRASLVSPVLLPPLLFLNFLSAICSCSHKRRKSTSFVQPNWGSK